MGGWERQRIRSEQVMPYKIPPKDKNFKKGQSGNPKGSSKKQMVIGALRRLTIDTYREAIEFAMSNNSEKLVQLIKDPKSTGLQQAVASCLLNAIRKGDVGTVEMLASRILGKIPDKLIVDPIVVAHISFNDSAKLKAALKKFHDEF